MSSLRKDLDNAEMRRLYDVEGKSLLEIGRLLGCGTTTVATRLEKEGHARRSIGRPPGGSGGRPMDSAVQQRDTLIYDLYKKGAIQRRLAVDFGMTQPRICQIIKKMKAIEQEETRAAELAPAGGVDA